MDEHEGTTQSTETSAAPPEASATAHMSPGQRRWYVVWHEWLRPLILIAVVMFSFRSAVADWNDVPTGSMKPTILEGDRIFINKVAYDLKFPFTTWRLAEWSDPTWGDIVVLLSPEDGKRLVKRVVGLPGDVVEVRGGRLYLNGEGASYMPLDEELVHQIERYMPQAFHEVPFAREEVEGREHAVMGVWEEYGDLHVLRGATGNPLCPVTQEGEDPLPLGHTFRCEVPPGHFFMMGDNRSNSRDSRVFGAVPRERILGRAVAVAISLDLEHFYMPRWGRFFSKLE